MNDFISEIFRKCKNIPIQFLHFIFNQLNHHHCPFCCCSLFSNKKYLIYVYWLWHANFIGTNQSTSYSKIFVSIISTITFIITFNMVSLQKKLFMQRFSIIMLLNLFSFQKKNIFVNVLKCAFIMCKKVNVFIGYHLLIWTHSPYDWGYTFFIPNENFLSNQQK
jgi:hypothetical protein